MLITGICVTGIDILKMPTNWSLFLKIELADVNSTIPTFFSGKGGVSPLITLHHTMFPSSPQLYTSTFNVASYSMKCTCMCM